MEESLAEFFKQAEGALMDAQVALVRLRDAIVETFDGGSDESLIDAVTATLERVRTVAEHPTAPGSLKKLRKLLAKVK